MTGDGAMGGMVGLPGAVSGQRAVVGGALRTGMAFKSIPNT